MYKCYQILVIKVSLTGASRTNMNDWFRRTKIPKVDDGENILFPLEEKNFSGLNILNCSELNIH